MILGALHAALILAPYLIVNEYISKLLRIRTRSMSSEDTL